MTDPIAKPSESADVLADIESARQRAAEDAINRRLFETSIDLILVVDRKGDFIRVSPSAQSILGYSREEMVGHSAAEFIYSEDLESTREEMRHARRGWVTRNFNCRYVHKAGRVVPLAWTGVWSEPGAAALLHRPRHDGAHRLARTPALKVVFASGYPDAPASGDWLTPGARLLIKP